MITSVAEDIFDHASLAPGRIGFCALSRWTVDDGSRHSRRPENRTQRRPKTMVTDHLHADGTMHPK
jgi:hypothetical protein